MDSTVLSALLALIGSLAGTFGGSRLTLYRLKKLEEKVDKHNQVHNQVIDRTYKLEQRAAVIDEEIKVANHRLNDLEKERLH